MAAKKVDMFKVAMYGIGSLLGTTIVGNLFAAYYNPTKKYKGSRGLFFDVVATSTSHRAECEQRDLCMLFVTFVEFPTSSTVIQKVCVV
jgi:hypothetical protein